MMKLKVKLINVLQSKVKNKVYDDLFSINKMCSGTLDSVAVTTDPGKIPGQFKYLGFPL